MSRRATVVTVPLTSLVAQSLSAAGPMQLVPVPYRPAGLPTLRRFYIRGRCSVGIRCSHRRCS